MTEKKKPLSQHLISAFVFILLVAVAISIPACVYFLVQDITQ